MNTNDAAERIGTTPRQLRQFLRSPQSTFVPVGSGARYEFTERELRTLADRFHEWQTNGKPKAEPKPAKKLAPPKPTQVDPDAERLAKDRMVWAEEEAERAAKGLGPIQLPNIKDPRIRARVRADERAREDRLNLRLIAAGLHISQLGDRVGA